MHAPLSPQSEPDATPVAKQKSPTSPEYIDGEQVRARYGGRSPMWLARRKREPDFPKPAFYIAGRQFFLLEDLKAWEASLPRESDPSMAATAREWVGKRHARRRAQKAEAQGRRHDRRKTAPRPKGLRRSSPHGSPEPGPR